MCSTPLVRTRHALPSRCTLATRPCWLAPVRRSLRPPCARRDEDGYPGDDLDEDDTFWEQLGEIADDAALEDLEEGNVAYDPSTEARSAHELRMQLIDEPSSGLPVLPVLAGVAITVAAIVWKRNSGSGPDSAADTDSKDKDDGEVRSNVCCAPIYGPFRMYKSTLLPSVV